MLCINLVINFDSRIKYFTTDFKDSNKVLKISFMVTYCINFKRQEIFLLLPIIKRVYVQTKILPSSQ